MEPLYLKGGSAAFYDAMAEHYSDPDYYHDTYLDIDAGASVAVMCFTRKFKNILMKNYLDTIFKL